MAAGITYWVLAVPDEKSARAAYDRGMRQCFYAHEMEVDKLHAGGWGAACEAARMRACVCMYVHACVCLCARLCVHVCVRACGEVDQLHDGGLGRL
jgi:hypothetical protein